MTQRRTGPGTLVRCERGAIAIEWAFIAPVVMLLLVGVLDFALAAHHKMQMENAVRAGLQYATVRKPVGGGLDGVESAVHAAAPADTTGTRQVSAVLYCTCPDGQPVDCADSCTGGSRHAMLAVAMEEDYRVLLGLPMVPATFRFAVDGTVRLN